MTNKTQQEIREIRNLMDGISEFYQTATDEEIRLDIVQEGIDPSSHAEEARRATMDALAGFRKKRLADARVEYERQRDELARGRFVLPRTPDERHKLLVSVLARHAQSKAVLTLHHREFDQMTDEDIATLLQQLAALGLVDDPGPGST